MSCQRFGSLEQTHALHNISSDETTESDQDNDEGSQLIHLGHFRVNFDSPGFSGGDKWTMGRGSKQNKEKGTTHRNVDFILASPRYGRSQIFSLHMHT